MSRASQRRRTPQRRRFRLARSWPATRCFGRPPIAASRSSRTGDAAFAVTGAGIERLVARYDLENEEALAHFERRLRGIGVLRALEAEGFKAGDEVEIAGVAFRPGPGGVGSRRCASPDPLPPASRSRPHLKEEESMRRSLVLLVLAAAFSLYQASLARACSASAPTTGSAVSSAPIQAAVKAAEPRRLGSARPRGLQDSPRAITTPKGRQEFPAAVLDHEGPPAHPRYEPQLGRRRWHQARLGAMQPAPARPRTSVSRSSTTRPRA